MCKAAPDGWGCCCLRYVGAGLFIERGFFSREEEEMG